MNLFDDSAQVADNVNIEKQIKEDIAVDKLKEFADVDDTVAKDIVGDFQLEFSVDENALQAVNQDIVAEVNVTQSTPAEVVPIKESVIETTSTEKEIRAPIVTSDNTETSPAISQEVNSVAVEIPRTDPVDKMDYVLDTVDEYANKALKQLGSVTLKGLKRFKHQVPRWLSNYQDSKIHKKFENGEFVIAEDFEYFMCQKELMVYRYTGTSQHVVIPDYVGNLPVRYIDRGFLNKNIFDNHKLRSFMSFFKEDNVADLSLDALKDSIAGVKSLQLPKELVYLPKNLFSGLKYMKTLIVPEQVRLLSPSVFAGCAIENVYFNGDVPKNLRLLELSPNVNLFCKKEYESRFKEELERRKL